MLLCNHQVLKNKKVSVSDTKYTRHSTKANKYLVSIHTIVSF